MGMCSYYLVAQFKTDDEAVYAIPVIKNFLRKLDHAHSAWQSIRGDTDDTTNDRYIKLKKQFPGVFNNNYLPESKMNISNDDEKMNFLAGKLDGPEDKYIDRGGNTVYISGDVWHFADWEPLAHFMRSIGAVKAGWASEEEMNFDYYGQVEMK